ncbi:MAG: hypothetical protein MMC33_001284 [Icmadophila ericetorum]|nr:hypothetical protein [Icmadophila ericetorum]
MSLKLIALEGSIPASKQKYIPTSGTYPKGFSASGTHVGVKASNTRFPDLAIIASDRPCTATAVFTRNIFKAAPVQVSYQTIKARKGSGLRGVVINSGCANAVTGKGGIDDAKAMATALDSCYGSTTTEDHSASLVMSTGVIGQRLPIDKIVSAIPQAYEALDSTHDSWLSAARAICTTDTFPKLLSKTFTLPSDPSIIYSIAGMAKGAGMIHPNMATLLGVICTDVSITKAALSEILRFCINRSFNSISIDGDTSTNDTVAMFANGAAGGPQISSKSSDQKALEDVLLLFTQELSQLVVRDGEGATKFVRVQVKSAAKDQSARMVARSIAKSPLVKTALYGKDANWGRILCAIGYSNMGDTKSVVPERTSVSFIPTDGSPELKLLVNGEPEKVDEERASEILQHEDLHILVDLKTGSHEANYWFCDFSHEYVTINGDYRT